MSREIKGQRRGRHQYVTYMDTLAAEIGCKPNIGEVTHTRTFSNVLYRITYIFHTNFDDFVNGNLLNLIYIRCILYQNMIISHKRYFCLANQCTTWVYMRNKPSVDDINTVNLADKTEVLRIEPNIPDHVIYR